MKSRLFAYVLAFAALVPALTADDGAAPLLTSDIVISGEEATIDLATTPQATWEIVVASMNVLGYSVTSADVQNTYGWLTVDDVWVAVGSVPYKPGTWSRVRVRVGSFESADEQKRAEVLLVAIATRFDERMRAASAPPPVAAEPVPETGFYDVPVYGRGATTVVGGGGGGGDIIIEDNQPDVFVNYAPPILSTSFALGCGYSGFGWSPAWGFHWNRYYGWSPWGSYGYGFGGGFGYGVCNYPIVSPSFYYGCGWSPFGFGYASPWFGPTCWYDPFYYGGFGFFGGGLAFWWYDDHYYDDWWDDYYDHHHDYDDGPGNNYGNFPNNGRGRLARIERENNILDATPGRDVDGLRQSAPRGSLARDDTPRVSVGGDDRGVSVRGDSRTTTTSPRTTTTTSSRTVMPRIVRTETSRSTVRVGGSDRVTISPVERSGELISGRTSDRTGVTVGTGRSSTRLPSSPVVIGRTSTTPTRTSTVTVRSRSGIPYVSSSSPSPTTSSRSSVYPPSTSRSASSYGRTTSPSSSYRSPVTSSRSSSSYRAPSVSSRSSSSYRSSPSVSTRSSSSYRSSSSSSRSSPSRSSISSRGSSSRSSISRSSGSSRSSGRSSGGRSSGRSSGGRRR